MRKNIRSVLVAVLLTMMFLVMGNTAILAAEFTNGPEEMAEEIPVFTDDAADGMILEEVPKETILPVDVEILVTEITDGFLSPEVNENSSNEEKAEIPEENPGMDTGLYVPQTMRVVTGLEGSSVLLETEASVNDEVVLTYSWIKKVSGSEEETILDCTEPSMEVIVETEEVEYGCSVTDEYGNTVYVTFRVSPIETDKIQVSYDSNGGENAPEMQEKEKDQILVLSSDVPVRKGYQFLGWAKTADAKEVFYQSGAEYTENESIVLYAVWKANTYRIKYYKNGGTGKMTASSATYGKNKTLRKNTFVREGYTFKEWNTKRDGSGTAYGNAQKVKNLTDVQGETVNLYAQWKAITYQITYDLNKGTNSDENPISYTPASDTITLKKPTRKGYTFKGWYTNEEWKTKVTEIQSGSIGDIKLYAKWSANTYTINYYKNGGTGTMKASSATYGKNKTLRTNAFTRKGYVFTGWNTERDGSGKSYSDAQKVKNLTSKANGSKSLFAQWKPIEYKIRYYGNGADGSMKASVATYDKNKTLRTNTFSRKGYIYTGWNTKKDGSGKSYKDKQKVKNLTSTDGNTVRLYAQWKKISEIQATTCDVDDIVTYFKEVVLDVEYSSGSGDFTLVQKWTEPIYYRVSGYATSKDMEVLNNMIRQLNQIDGFPGIYPENDQHWANMFISFYNYDDFYTYMGPVVNYESSDGAVQYWYDTYENYIYEATIGYRTDIGQYVRNSVIQEEIYNGLGITDTWLREDSIAYGGYSEPQQLSDIDWLILELLYHPDMKCGMNAAQCEKVIRNIFS